MNPEKVLRRWLSEIAESADLEVSLFADRGREKWAAWLQFEAPSAAGQLTVWNTGEGNLEVYRLDGEPVLLRSEEGGDEGTVRDWADEVLASVTSGAESL